MPRGFYKRTEEYLEKLKKQGFQKGSIVGIKTRFKKGHMPINVFKKGQFGEKSGHWKGGKINSHGYIRLLTPQHPLTDNQGYVKRSRLICEKRLGRYLKRSEMVHHINKIKTDDQPENLIAFASESAHQRFHHNPNNVKPEEIIFDGRELR